MYGKNRFDITGIALVVAIAALTLGASPAHAGPARTDGPEQYRGPSGEVQSELGRLEIGDSLSDENAPFPPEQWHRWEFWFEHEKDCLIRTALENRRKAGDGMLPVSLFAPCEVEPVRQSPDRARHIVPALRFALNDRSPEVRTAALLALGNAGDSVYRDEITEHLLRGTIQERRAAALSLGLIGKSQSVPLLVRVVRKSRDAQLSTNAALSLGLIGGEAARRELSRLLASLPGRPSKAAREVRVDESSHP